MIPPENVGPSVETALLRLVRAGTAYATQVFQIAALQLPKCRMTTENGKLRLVTVAEASCAVRTADCVPDLARDQHRILMLPEPQHLPAKRFKRRVCLPVPLYVPRQFR